MGKKDEKEKKVKKEKEKKVPKEKKVKKEKEKKVPKEKKVKKDKKDKKNKTPPPRQEVWDIESTTQEETDDEGDVQSENEPSRVQLKSSFEELDKRNDTEKMLFELLQSGNRAGMRELIRENRNEIDVNKKDRDGFDILTKGVESKDEKMVQLLLKIDPDNIFTRDALLCAVKENDMGMVVALLFFDDLRKSQGDKIVASMRSLVAQKSSQKKKKEETIDQSVYGNDITPFLMAAVHGHYEIMEVLYNRGERLAHKPSCKCAECLESAKKPSRFQKVISYVKGNTNTSLEAAQARLELMKGLSNPYYMILMAGRDGEYDPILESFVLAHKIQKLMTKEAEFEEEYEKILSNLKKFPVELLDMCRTLEETKTVLTQTKGYIGPDVTYPRLAFAIQKRQTEFVAHHNPQHLMFQQWVGEHWNPKTNIETYKKHLFTLMLMVFFPIVNLFVWFGLFGGSQTKPVKTLLSPVNRFRGKLGSYLFFCGLLFYMNMEERAEADIEPPTMYVRYIILVYVLSFTLSLVRQFMLNPVGFLDRGWNLYDVVVVVLFWGAGERWLHCWLGEDENETGFGETRLRKHLPNTHPLLLGECFFALATTLAICRILRFFVVHPTLGPLQVSMARMAYGYRYYLIFFVLVYFTFFWGSAFLIRPYANVTKVDEKTGKIVEQKTDILSVADSIRMMHFGGIGRDDLTLLVPWKKVKVNGVLQRIDNPQTVTQHFLSTICVAYTVGFGFLSGTLGGLMSNTKKGVKNAQDIEWKYIRCQEWMYHYLDANLAPPFNLLPNGTCIANVFTWIASTVAPKDKENAAGCDMHQCCYLRKIETPEQTEDNLKKYPELLRRLIQRYFQYKRANVEEDQPQKLDVEKVQGGVKEIKDLVTKIGEKNQPKSTLQGNSSVRTVLPPQTSARQAESTDLTTDE